MGAINVELKIEFGGFSPKIQRQLSDQGYKYSPKIINEFQRNVTHSMCLYYSGLINDKERAKINTRIFKKILSHLRSKN